MTLLFYECSRCGHYHEPADDRPYACEHYPWRYHWLNIAFPGWRLTIDPDEEGDDGAYSAAAEAADDARAGR